MTGPRRGYHRCPRSGCLVQVPDALFSCLDDWRVLPANVRKEIGRTSRMSLLAMERRLAVNAAINAWKRLDQRA